jgi:gliding motility-associated-like protein
MNYRSAVKILFPVLFPVVLFAQERTSLSTMSSAIARPSRDASEESVNLNDRKNWVENVSERTVYSSRFTTPDGHVICHYSKQPLNYSDASGNLQPIDFTMKSSDNGWSAVAQPFPTFLNSDGSAAVSPAKDLQFVFGKNVSVNGNPVPARVPVMMEHMAKISNIIPGMDKEYGFKLNGIKYNYVLNQPVATVNGFLTISEELEIPQGYILKRGENRGYEKDGGWCGDFELIAPDGEVASKIFSPLCFDSNHKWMIAAYKLRNENGHQFLDLLVPAGWLNDPSLSYPVTIDPLVTGPLSVYGPALMNSCIMPTSAFDSILVTIPAQIAVTEMLVSDDFYADQFTIAVKGDGRLWFSTPCNTTTVFTAASDLFTPGPVIMDTFNLKTPLLCCYPQSCSAQSFYLTQHLARVTVSTGCNLTYIRYDPAQSFGIYQFEAYVIGRTVEPFGAGWSVQPTPICSDVCTFTGTVNTHYGVPPYTITHPWMTGTITTNQTPAGCSYSPNTTTLTLTRPICPTYCDTATLLAVPPPTVIDACGNVSMGLPVKYLHLKPTPLVTATPDPDSICSGPVNIILTSCIPNSTFVWNGNSHSGTGNISDTLINSGTSPLDVSYYTSATANGCTSPVLNVPVVVAPRPAASYVFTQPAVAGLPVVFTNTSAVTGTGNLFLWAFGDGATSFTENTSHTFAEAGVYHVCFTVSSGTGCTDSICEEVSVIPASLIAPNVITPNADGANDFLVFRDLEFYANNHLDIYDRWGLLLYSKDGYQNNWDGSKYTDGTYYYVLSTIDDGKQYTGFFQIIK